MNLSLISHSLLHAAPTLYFPQWLVLAKLFPILLPLSTLLPLLEGILAPLCLAGVWDTMHVMQCPLRLCIKAALFPDHTIQNGLPASLSQCTTLCPRSMYHNLYYIFIGVFTFQLSWKCCKLHEGKNRICYVNHCPSEMKAYRARATGSYRLGKGELSSSMAPILRELEAWGRDTLGASLRVPSVKAHRAVCSRWE